jgi:hypothetical protein
VPAQLDHLVVTAANLATGAEFLHRALGVMPQVGGEHPRMGTHNCLVRLGERLYLEVIAADREAPRPGRPRWFQLDQRDSVRACRLAAWVVRTDDIRAAAAASPVPLGNIEPMSRGRLEWLITIPEDGSLPLAGVAPVLIEWPAASHPADALQDTGCRLLRLEGFHPRPDEVDAVVKAVGFEGEFTVSPLPPGEPPHLLAHLQTPAGRCRLRGA